MSRKSRERREKHKGIRPDDYFTNGIIEMARFGKNTIVRNNSTPEQHAAHMQFLREQYPQKHQKITQKVEALREKVARCDPYGLLMYLRRVSLSTQLNIFSEIDFSSDANAYIYAQEYVQSILISSENSYDSTMSDEDEAALYAQILIDFEDLYKELQLFYTYWAAHIQHETGIDSNRLAEIVESQYMYWVRGNRYQIFELEPLKKLLPPHDSILQELFGVSAEDIIAGLEKLRYSLSMGYADALMDFGKEFDIFSKAVEAGISPAQAHKDAEHRTSKIADKLVGSDLIKVKDITGWDDRFVDMLSAGINDYPDFGEASDFSGWPIVDLPVMKKPFIKIDGTSYAFLYYALFDNIYRIIQKAIFSARKDYVDDWKDKQTTASEEMVRDLFLRILPGAEAHIGNYYPAKNSLKQLIENDIIILYHNNLFIIEVKAGSFPSTPPITDFDAHVNAYHNLAEVADSQCSRTLEYITKHSQPQFYSRDKQPTFRLHTNSFSNVFTFSVTVDNFNEFAAKAEKLSVISLKEDTIVVSYDDLLVYAGYFDSPTVFLHYLKQRKAAMHIPQYQMHDEFDHLGLYIDRNMYALNPDQYGDVKNVFWHGFRENIDNYFCMLFADPTQAQKPVQTIPPEVTEIIKYLDAHISEESILFAHFLLDMSTDAKNDFAGQIKYALKRQKEISRSVPMIAFGDFKYCAFIAIPGVAPYPIEKQRDYVYAATSRNEEIPVMWISLEYDSNNNVTSAYGKHCSFAELLPEDRDRLRAYGKEKAKDWIELYRQTHPKLGRNDICPCGSGKKHKFCCLNVE